jgi:hypothetical protein
MKKIWTALCLTMLAASMSFASVYRNSTAGVLYNEFDDIADGLLIFDVTNNVLGLGATNLGAWMNANGNSWNFYGGLVKGLPMDMRISVSLQNNESYTNANTVMQTNVVVSGAASDTYNRNVTWNVNNADNSARNETVIFALPLANMPVSISYNYSQYGPITNGTFAVSAAGLGAISTSTVSDGWTTNQTNIGTRSSLIYGVGYNDFINVTNTISPNVRLGDLNVYVPISVGAAGNNQFGSSSNVQTVVSNKNFTNNSEFQSYTANGKEDFVAVNPAVLLNLDDKVKGLAVDANIKVGYGWKNNIASAWNDAINNYSGTTNGSVVNNILFQNGYGHLSLSGGASAWYYLSMGKLTIETRPQIQAGFDNAGYVGLSSNYSSSTVNFTNASSNLSLSYSTNNVSAVNYKFSLPIGIEYPIFDWLKIRSGATYSYYLGSMTYTTNSGTSVSYASSGGVVTTNRNGTYNNPSVNMTSYAFSTFALNFGLGFKIADGVYVDANLTSTIADATLIGGANRFIFGSFFDQFSDTTKWSLEAKYLF